MYRLAFDLGEDSIGWAVFRIDALHLSARCARHLGGSVWFDRPHDSGHSLCPYKKVP